MRRLQNSCEQPRSVLYPPRNSPLALKNARRQHGHACAKRCPDRQHARRFPNLGANRCPGLMSTDDRINEAVRKLTPDQRRTLLELLEMRDEAERDERMRLFAE